ncbi:Ig-like domain-containing protein [Vibrio chagasii]|nr:Ig-like domain-containing protein [Vibrio chagasii]
MQSLSDLAASSDTGTSDTDNLTKDGTPTITGHLDIPYSQVTIYDGSTPNGHAVSDGSGQYSVAVATYRMAIIIFLPKRWRLLQFYQHIIHSFSAC